MNPIAEDSQIEQLDDNRWKVNFADRWSVRDIPNGGYQMAAVAKALENSSTVLLSLSLPVDCGGHF